MHNFFKLISYIKPYKIYAFLNLFFNILTILFAIFSLGMMIPLLKLIIGVEGLTLSAPIFDLMNKDTWLPNLYYQMSLMIQEHGAEHVLVLISVAIIIMFFFKNVFRYLAMWILSPLRNGVIRDLRNAVYTKFLILPLSYFSEKKKGDLIARATNDVQDVEWTIMGSLEIIFRDSITVIAYMTTLFIISTKLTLVMLIVLPVAGLIIGKIGKSLRKKSLIAQNMNGVMLSFFEEAIGGLRIIKAFNAIGYSKNKFEKHNDGYTKVMISVFRRGDLSAPLSEFFGIVVMAVVLWYGGKLILSNDGTMDGPTFIFYVTLFSQVIPSIKSFSSGYYRIQKGTASAQRIWEVIEADEEIVEKENAVSKTKFENSIEYRNLSFKYENDIVLKNINLSVTKGKTIALVGASGSGKTTMVNLLPRFYEANEGGLFIDDINIQDMKIHDLRELMGIVNQESILFHDTIFNNIAFGMDNVSEEEVIAAAKVANAHEFIKDLPEGYHSHIGDSGNKLSGGQKQRISIARAVLKNPPIMILDEATSALDTESERLVQEALENLMKNRTSVVIAHRLSTIKNADEIVVMSKGEIKERGNHQELIAKEGIYHRLHSMQSFKD
ncbi:MAG: ATP-binding cassette domain-containing protein [Bacteroidales bacterium]|nr:ATP-binding cassette domain-containing protein [Bacteroidales bacterium]